MHQVENNLHSSTIIECRCNKYFKSNSISPRVIFVKNMKKYLQYAKKSLLVWVCVRACVRACVWFMCSAVYCGIWSMGCILQCLVKV